MEKREAVGSEKSPSFGVPDVSENTSKNTSKSTPEKIVPEKNAKDTDEKVKSPTYISAATIFADRYPSFFADSNNARSQSESRIVLSTLIVIILGVITAWIFWDERYFQTDGDLVYNMGLTGGLLLLVCVLYASRKRVKMFKNFGDVTTWYYVHLVAGIVGPVLIILHSSFSLKSMNSTVALISMLCVIASGIFGRYIYTRIGYDLHRQLIAIRDTEERLVNAMHQYQGKETEAVEMALSTLTSAVVSTPRHLYKVPGRYLALRAKAAACYVKSTKEITAILKKRAIQEGWDKKLFRVELAREKRYLREHVNALVKIGQSHFYERLLVGWRVFHIPLLFILVISGSVHVLAIHMY